MNQEEFIDDELIQLSMQILLHAGDARKLCVDSLEAVSNQDYNLAEEKINEAEKRINIAHGLQTETLQKEASGEMVRYSTLFSHAQDTLMTTKSEIIISEQLINIFRKLIGGPND